MLMDACQCGFFFYDLVQSVHRPPTALSLSPSTSLAQLAQERVERESVVAADEA